MKIRCRYSGARAHLWIEFRRDRVHAIAVAGRPGAVREHVPEVAAAVGARDLDATHPKSTVLGTCSGSSRPDGFGSDPDLKLDTSENRSDIP